MVTEHKWRTEVRATCSCGWRSPRAYNGPVPMENDRAAMLDFVAHSKACRVEPAPAA